MVAAEVKQLASQTAKATEEIAVQVTEIQSATGDCVVAESEARWGMRMNVLKR